MSSARNIFTFNQSPRKDNSGEQLLTPKDRAGIAEDNDNSDEQLLTPKERAAIAEVNGHSKSRWSPKLSPSLRRRSPYSTLKVSPSRSDQSPESDDPKENSTPKVSLFSADREILETPNINNPSPRSRFSIVSKQNLADDQIEQAAFIDITNSNRDDAKSEVSSLLGLEATSIFRIGVKSNDEGAEMVIGSTDDSVYIENDSIPPSTQEDVSMALPAVPVGLQNDLPFVLPGNPTRRALTELHDMCQNASTVEELMRAKAFLDHKSSQKGRAVNDASTADIRGRTPLHRFSLNKNLASALGRPSEFDLETREYLRLYQQPTFDQDAGLEKQVMRFLIGDLLAAYPGAMMIRDDQGRIPFEAGLTEWVDMCHDRPTDNKEYESTSKFPSFPNAAGKLSQVWESTSSTVRDAVKSVGRHMNRPNQYMHESSTTTSPRVAPHAEGGDDSQFALQSPLNQNQGSHGPGSERENMKARSFPSNVQLSAHFRYTLVMLSAVVDQLDRYMTPGSFKKEVAQNRGDLGYDLQAESFDRAMRELRTFRDIYGSVDISTTVVQRVASIPDLIKTIMLIEDEDDKQFALSTSIMKRVMMSELTIGSWLTTMLQCKSKKISYQAIDYLKIVSELVRETSTSKSKGSRDFSGCDDLINEVSRLQDFVPAMLALGEKGIEEASTTLLVQKVLDRMISRPFAVTVVFCDGFFLAILIWGFRAAVNRILTGGSLDVVLQYIYVANTGIFYFIIREIAKTVSLCLISKRSRIHFLSFWNLIDMLATALALVSTISMRYHFTYLERGLDDTGFLRGLLAITTGFLWLRVLSFLKAINMQLATFVLAILQISKDIIWFCVILLTMIVSFAQMFFTLLAPASCADAGGSDKQCSEAEYLLRTYQVLLGDFGDFDRDDLTTGFSIFLVVFYSFMVVVVLLNVLIAIASDSYEKCLVRSPNLFGRTRVMLIAELVSFQSLLRQIDGQETHAPNTHIYNKWWSKTPWGNNSWSRGSVLFFTLSLLVVAGWVIGEVVGYANGESYGNVLFGLLSIIVNVSLFILIMLFLASGAAGISKKKDDSQDKNREKGAFRRWITDWNNGCIQRSMLRLLGASGGIIQDGPFHKGDATEDWHGRVNYIQREMTRHAEESAVQAQEQSKAMESFVTQSEVRLRGEMDKLEESFRDLRNSVMGEVMGTKETNANVAVAVAELKALISMAASHSGGRTSVPSEVNLSNNRFLASF